MNDSDTPKRGRPKKHTGKDVQVHVVIDKVLWDAAHDPKQSQTLTVTRALRMCLTEGRRDNIPAIKIAWLEARKEAAHATLVIADCRSRLQRMGIDCDEFEETLGD